ncbi:hypothetical protein EYR36_010695 [Pleurotus pulmonarius]|nr:hypothetical protein EYR36_010695 [Pleurotus pulmonarius]
MPTCSYCGDEAAKNHEHRVHPLEVSIKPNEHEIVTIPRSSSFHYQCPFCPTQLSRANDIRTHVTQAHAGSFSSGSSRQEVSIPFDCPPSSLKRPTDSAAEQPMTPKRLRLDPSSSPPTSPPYTTSEPHSDVTIVPSSPTAELPILELKPIAHIPQVPRQHVRQSRRREVLKTFTLKQAGIYFHPPTRLFLCVECTAAVPSLHIPTHVNESCPRSVRYDPSRLASQMQELDPQQCPIIPVEGLEAPIPLLPVIQGWRCEVPGPCHGHVFGAESTKFNHHKERHHHQQPSFSEVQCQRVFNGRKMTKYVLINHTPKSDKSTLTASSWQELKEKLLAQGTLTIRDEREVSHTQLSPLENVTQWHRTLKGAHLGLARIYCRQPEPAPAAPSTYHRLFDAFKHYIVHVVAPVLELRSNTMLLRLINSSDKGICERYPFRLPQNRSTVSHYAYIFSCMMIFVVRAVDKPIPGFPVTCTDSQLDLIRQLLQIDIPVELDHAPLPFWRQIHSACWSLLTSIPVSTALNELDIPLSRFLIAYHLRDDMTSRFKPATHICHNMIAIQWCWRAMALYQCKQSAPEQPEGEIGIYQSISQYLTEGSHSPFAILRSFIHPITAISMKEPSLPLFLMGADMETFSFKSHPFTMSSFKEFAVGLVTRSESLLLTILDGLDIEELEARITAALSLDNHTGWFQDELRSEKMGYSFLTDERNMFGQYEDVLMDRLCREHRASYAVETHDGIQMKPNALLSFIDDVDELVEHMYAALTFTWAGAARGTEIEDIRYCNTHSPRNLYFTNGVLTFVTFYNKTQHNTGRQSMIPRAVPPRLARLFIILLAVIYPCVKYIAAMQTSKDHAALYSSCIFVHRARPLNTERMTDILGRFTQETFIFALGVRDSRHLMKFVLRHAVGLSLQEDPGDTPSLYRILDGLWGHSSKVSQAYYAVEEDTFSYIDDKEVTKAQIFSLAYHEWLGIGYERLPANLRIQHIAEDKVQNPTPAGKIDTSAFVQTTIPVLGDALQATVFDAIHTYMDMQGIQPRAAQLNPTNISTSSRIIVHPTRKKALERLYGTTQPRFSSPQQGEIFELVMQNTRHVLGILPTGGGKSLMFYGPPLLEADGITIVVSPFVALANQQYAEAKRYGINVVQWPSSNIDCSTVRLLVVNAEHLVHGQLHDWLTAASKQRLIKRIIFDEAHEILISSNYRDCYSQVKSLMDLGVTIIFLTATIYRHSIPALAKAFEIETLEVIAAPTMRTNIRYQVDQYGDQRLLLENLVEAYSEALKNAAPRDRLLIYCHSYDECDQVAAKLRLPVHKSKYSDNPEADAITRTRCEQDWLMGVTPGLVATTGFGTGINYAYVTHVFIVNPYNMISPLPPVPPRYTYPTRDTRSPQESITMGSRGQATSSNTMNFHKSNPSPDHAQPHIPEDSENPTPLQIFFDAHGARAVTPLVASASRPNGHLEDLTRHIEAGNAKRESAQERNQSLKRLIDMRGRCITCQVFGKKTCGNQEVFGCTVGIYGFKCQYTINEEPLSTIYSDVYKSALKAFDQKSRVCWMCYFPFSYKPHTKNDDTCNAQKDLLSPIAWALFCLPIVLPSDVGRPLQDKLLTAAGIETPIFESAERYSQWLAKPHPTVNHTANIVELCIAFEQLFHAKNWP